MSWKGAKSRLEQGQMGARIRARHFKTFFWIPANGFVGTFLWGRDLQADPRFSEIPYVVSVISETWNRSQGREKGSRVYGKCRERASRDTQEAVGSHRKEEEEGSR